jgi:hypothetical protein
MGENLKRPALLVALDITPAKSGTTFKIIYQQG